MCGIAGYWTTDERGRGDAAADVLARQIAALRHRGPDGTGAFHDERDDAHVALGHARLSIIDLEGGRQPIANEDESLFLIVNGEIYNYRALTAELEAKGHRFRTQSDCEVILHLWEEEGEACVDRLRGMFAFVLYDRKRGVLFGARDRFGQKPLFWSGAAGGFAFASEIKALLTLPWMPRELDVVALDQFLALQFVPHPRTMFEGISQMPPGHRFTSVAGGPPRIEPYWRPTFTAPDPVSDAEHLDRVQAALEDAVESHLIADVPVGVFLSGGIDSSLVALLAARTAGERLRSFSIAFPGERLDESVHARAAAAHAGTDHTEFAFGPEHLAEQIEGLARTFDQPLADVAALPLTYLSEHASKETKVVLTGDGGDELFAGYDRYRKAARPGGIVPWLDRTFPSLFDADRLSACGPDPLKLRKLRTRLAYHHLPLRECVYPKNQWEAWDRHALYGDELRERLGGSFEGLSSRADGAESAGAIGRTGALNRMLHVEQLGYLPDDLLLKTDYATMASGLEARAPFLDHELAAVAAGLPTHLKATADETKVALRRLSDRLLPADLARRPKQGFGVPVGRWFRDELRAWARDRLLDPNAAASRLFRPEKVRRILDEHVARRHNRASKIYSLLFFELWASEYL